MMPAYHRPATLDAALACLAADPGLKLLAGGTDVYPSMGEKVRRQALLDLTGIADLRGITRADGWVRLGALTTWTDILRADLPAWFEGLRLAAREVGSIQIQNVATVAGNICNASPAADGTAALLALDAEVEIRGPAGPRRVRLGDFVTGVRRVALAPGELVTALYIPDRGDDGRARFLKLGARHYLVISIAMVAATLHRDKDGRIAHAAVAVGSCSPVALRLPGLEAKLIGRRPDEAAGQVDPTDLAPLSPIDDVRATAAYRREAAFTLVRRTLAQTAAAFDASPAAPSSAAKAS